MEAHNITEANSAFFKQNRVKSCIALTATPPSDSMKKQYLAECNLPTIYSLDLDTAIKLRLVSPYEITVIETRLESSKKTVPGGTKEKPFLNTEKNQYDYLTKTISSLMFNRNRTPQQAAALQFKILNRMHFIYGLESKAVAAELVLKTYLNNPAERTMIFSSNIKQAERLCAHTFHSKSKSDKDFDDFKSGRINTMACVKSANEGHNIPVKIDNALIVQVNSKDLDLVQRMGRILRYKKGHVGKIFIIVCVDTVDENWANKALTGFDQSKITRIRISNIAA